MLASVAENGPYTGLKSLIKGWQNFLASCVVPKLPYFFNLFFLLPPLLPTLISDY